MRAAIAISTPAACLSTMPMSWIRLSLADESRG
jgi:hypothetical protein